MMASYEDVVGALREDNYYMPQTVQVALSWP